MATIEERLSAIEAELAVIPRRGKWTSAFEQDLREAALQYARVKTQGFYIEGKERTTMGKTETEEMAKYFERKMQTAAIALLRELGMEESQ